MNRDSTNTYGIEIREVDNRRRMKDFVLFPYRLYSEEKNWVPPLLMEEKKFLTSKHNRFLRKNPAALFVAYKNNIPVGRIAAIINRDHNRLHEEQAGFFGFFDTVEDAEVSRILLTTAAEWVKVRGARVLRGPTCFSVNNQAGMLIDGFDQPPFLLMPFNFPYYGRLLQTEGFRVTMRFFAYEVTDQTIVFPPVLDRLERRLTEHGIAFRTLDINDLDRESRIIKNLFNQAWTENWGFIPTNYNEVREDFKRVKPFLKPDLVFFAEHRGEPVGFSLSLPDINQALKPLNGRLFPFKWITLLANIKKINQIRVILMGILKDYRQRGIDLIFYKLTMENALRYGYRRAELSWILENNVAMNQVLEHIHAKKYKTYAIYEKEL